MDARDALAMAHSLRGVVCWLKVGMTLFYERGPRIVEELRELDFDVFLDLKLHDIPHQVEGAVRSVASLGARMLTVHATGGTEMLEAAVRGAHEGAAGTGVEPPALLAVTVLTSMSSADLETVGVEYSAAEQVLRLAGVARDAGVDGVVCSAQEAAMVRGILDAGALVVTPGIRPEWAGNDDQSRVATPSQALSRGASHLVIGRPITGAHDPRDAALRIIAEIEEGIA